MTRASRFGAGLVLGGLLAGSVIALGSSDSQEPGPSTAVPVTTSMVATTAAPFLEEGEVVFGSTVLLRRGFEVADGVAVLDYDLAGLTPSLISNDDLDHQGDVVMMPEVWELTTGAGIVIEETTGMHDHAVRFVLPSVDDTVERVDLVGWRVETVFGERIELVIVEGATGSFRSGLATIETVLEQSTSTIVQIDFDRTGDEWARAVLRPLDGGWRVSGRQGGGVQLIWDGTDAPEKVVLEDAGFVARPESGRVLVVEPGVSS